MATGKGRLYHANGDIYEGVRVDINYSKRIGRSINQKGMEYISMLMELGTKELGLMIYRMVTELKLGRMEQGMKEST